MNYLELLNDIKSRIRQARIKASLAVNAEMLMLYWDIGRIIDLRQKEDGWGGGIIPHLAKDIRNELPELKGFSERNIKRMLSFYREYRHLPIVPQPVAQLASGLKPEFLPQAVAKIVAQPVPQLGDESVSELMPRPVAQFDESKKLYDLAFQLPWGHNIILIEKVKDLSARLWYMKQALSGGWSRDTLDVFIRNEAFSRQGQAAHNFTEKLPSPQSELAASLLKDPYIFDFLTIEEPFHERELETELIRHVEKFLLELGSGFAFVGRQYHLDVGEQDFYIDLLVYHLKLRCFVVIDLKRGPFKPEYAGYGKLDVMKRSA